MTNLENYGIIYVGKSEWKGDIMATAIVHCKICKQAFNRLDPKLVEGVDWVKPTNRIYYHKKCYDDFAKKKGQIGKDGIEFEAEEAIWKLATEDYLKRDLKISIDYPRFNTQWKKYKEKDGYTPKGIYFALKYFYDIRKNPTEKSEGGIGIVSWIYEESAQYWGKRNQEDKGIVARLEEQIKKDMAQKPKIVFQKNKKRETKIDFSILEEEDEE